MGMVDAIRMFVEVTDLYGHVYIVREMNAQG